MPSNYGSGTNYVVDDSNTGYIIGGGYETRLNCDVRISDYDQSGNIDGAYSSGWVSGGIYTIGSLNGNTATVGQVVESTSGGTQTTNYGFTKYFDSKSSLGTTLSKSSSFYGVHFMNAPISKSHYVTLPSAVINGDTYTNLQMPEDCIDFRLKSKGSINFWSSYSYSNSSDGGANNCFFSLHEVFRNNDADKTIKQTRHILLVYKNNNNTNDGIQDGTYIYYYEDDDNTSQTGYYYYDSENEVYKEAGVDFVFNASNNSVIFNSEWIENPVKFGGSNNTRDKFYNQYSNKMFYFEIPVNVGEYALGSVTLSGTRMNGAYIMYLDIGANAAVVDRTTITQQSDVLEEKLVYATGIQLLAAGASFTSDANTAVAMIAANTTGTITFTRTGSTISFGGTSLDSTYWDEALTVTDATLNVLTNTTTTKVLKYIDFNNGTGTLYYATVIDSGGTKTYEVREIDGNTNPLIADQDTLHPEEQPYGLLKIGTGNDSGYGVLDTAAGAIGDHQFETTSETIEYYYYIPTSVITNDGLNYSFDMDVTKVTGTETIDDFAIANGTYTFNDGSGYTSTHCYKLVGDDITYVFTQIPTGLTNTKFVVTTKDSTYTVTINGTTIAVGNYTYTFSNNTIAASA